MKSIETIFLEFNKIENEIIDFDKRIDLFNEMINNENINELNEKEFEFHLENVRKMKQNFDYYKINIKKLNNFINECKHFENIFKEQQKTFKLNDFGDNVEKLELNLKTLDLYEMYTKSNEEFVSNIYKYGNYISINIGFKLIDIKIFFS